MDYYDRLARDYDRYEEMCDRQADEAMRKVKNKLSAVVKEYGTYFANDDIKALIKLLGYKDENDKARSDVGNLIYELEGLKDEVSEHYSTPHLFLIDMLEEC